MERDGLRHVDCPRHCHIMNIIRNNNLIPARTSTGSTRSALSVPHQGRGAKYATGVPFRKKIRARQNIAIGTWNVQTLNATGKVRELTNALDRYRWSVLGLCEVRWKNFGETTTDDGHRLYFSGRSDKHQHGVGFLVNRNIVNTVMGCKPVSSRLITIRLRSSPFNITIVQLYAPTSDYEDEVVEDFYDELQEVLDQIPKRDIIVVQGDWNAKVGENAHKDWDGVCGRYCNKESNDRGLRLLEFASLNNFKIANTFGPHKPSRRWTWHSPGHKYHNQIDYILVKRRFFSSVNIARTRSFPGADIGSDHDLVMMTFRLQLKNTNKSSHPRIKFDLDKLKDPNVAADFQAVIGGKFAPLMVVDVDHSNTDEFINKFNSAVMETAEEVLGKHRPAKKPWVTQDLLDLCDQRRNLKNKKAEKEGAEKYRVINKQIRKGMKNAKEKWIKDQCQEIELNLKVNNTKKAYQLVKELTNKKQMRTNTVLNKNGKCLTEHQDIVNRWTEYCSDLYNHNSSGDASVLNVPPATDNEDYPILREEVEEAVKSLKKGKSAGVDNIPAELVQAGGESMITVLTAVCNKIWQTGEWPTTWTQSLIITLPKKGNLQLCQNYRTISLICHASKVMLRILLNRLKPQSEKIIAEEQAGFRPGRSTTEQIFNLRILCERYLQHQQDLYHVFVDFKKAFDRVWHEALWATMRFYNINAKLTQVLQNLYAKATSAVYFNSSVGDWFKTTVGVRQGCLLSPTLFNIFLERIMTDALEDHNGTVSIGGKTITNLRFADDIDGLAGSENELVELVDRLDKTSRAYGMQISAEKTKVMTNNSRGFTTDFTVSGQKIDPVKKFKYLGAIVTDEGSKPEVRSRIAQATAAFAKLDCIWKDKGIKIKSKIRLMRSLVTSILLYSCETWTVTAEIERLVQSTEMKFFRRLLNISYRDRITNEVVRNRIRQAIGPYQDLLSELKKRKLKWYGHVSRSQGLAKTFLQGTVRGSRRRGRQKKRWEDNIPEWTGLSLSDSTRSSENRGYWRMISNTMCTAPTVYSC